MPVKKGDKAKGGDWEKISNLAFDITEDMIMEFEGKSCNIINNKGNVIGEFGEEDRLVQKDVLPGYQCFVMRVRIRFVKKKSVV